MKHNVEKISSDKNIEQASIEQKCRDILISIIKNK